MGSFLKALNTFRLIYPCIVRDKQKYPVNFVRFATSMCTKYRAVESGSKYSTDYVVYLYDQELKRVVSPFHDIPLFCGEKKDVVNMVVEIPRWTSAKLEISTKTELNPIKQDVKKGKPRFVHNLFPSRGYPWNYGALPQTWEDPDHTDANTNAKGDNDPIDVIEIGSRVFETGDVVPVKVLGCIALIDEGETDWKVIVIHKDDPRADKVSCISTLNSEFPGLLDFSIRWFRNYKVPAGSGLNKFAFEGEYYKDSEFAMEVIRSTHESWRKLFSGQTSSLALQTTVHQDSKFFVPESRAKEIEAQCTKKEVAQVPREVSDLCYVDLSRTR